MCKPASVRRILKLPSPVVPSESKGTRFRWHSQITLSNKIGKAISKQQNFASLNQIFPQDAQKGGLLTRPALAPRRALTLARPHQMEAPDAYIRRYVEDFDEPRTKHGEKRVAARWGWAGGKCGFFSILLRRHISVLRSIPISRKRRGIHFLRRKIGMPNKLPLEPLTRHPLIS